MDKIQVLGGTPLFGKIYVSGSKNSTLPAMAACLLTYETVTLQNVPDLHDISSMAELLLSHGANCEFKGQSGMHGSKERSVVISARDINNFTAHYDIVRKMRASVLVLGPLLARFGVAKVSLPGGCAIGARPINLHLQAFEKMGATITIENGYVVAEAKNGLQGADIIFDTVSVGATENVMMAAALAQGTTTIHNSAKEPEIVDLADLLNKMGADVKGAGTNIIVINGVAKLKGTKHSIIPDRIEAGTYAVAAVITKGELEIGNADESHLLAILENLKKTGATVIKGTDGIKVTGASKLSAIDFHTAPFPHFATDLQAQLMTLLCLAEGTSIVTETIFENRFMHVPELNRLGADITINDNMAVIRGVDQFKGAPVMASDLRASVSLVLGGLAAKGETIVNRIYHLDRGYEKLEKKLESCGAKVKRVG